MEHLLQTEGDGDKIEIGRDVAKLYGQTFDGKAH